MKKLRYLAASVIAVVSLAIYSPLSVATCYAVSNLTGVTAFEWSDYSLKRDGFTDQVFHVNFDGEDSNVTNAYECSEFQKNKIICNGVPMNLLWVEVWSVYPSSKRITLVRTRHAESIPGLNGSALFVGDIIGRCN